MYVVYLALIVWLISYIKKWVSPFFYPYIDHFLMLLDSSLKENLNHSFLDIITDVVCLSFALLSTLSIALKASICLNVTYNTFKAFKSIRKIGLYEWKINYLWCDYSYKKLYLLSQYVAFLLVYNIFKARTLRDLVKVFLFFALVVLFSINTSVLVASLLIILIKKRGLDFLIIKMHHNYRSKKLIIFKNKIVTNGGKVDPNRMANSAYNSKSKSRVARRIEAEENQSRNKIMKVNYKLEETPLIRFIPAIFSEDEAVKRLIYAKDNSNRYFEFAKNLKLEEEMQKKKNSGSPLFFENRIHSCLKPKSFALKYADYSRANHTIIGKNSKDLEFEEHLARLKSRNGCDFGFIGDYDPIYKKVIYSSQRGFPFQGVFGEPGIMDGASFEALSRYKSPRDGARGGLLVGHYNKNDFGFGKGEGSIIAYAVASSDLNHLLSLHGVRTKNLVKIDLDKFLELKRTGFGELWGDYHKGSLLRYKILSSYIPYAQVIDEEYLKFFPGISRLLIGHATQRFKAETDFALQNIHISNSKSCYCMTLDMLIRQHHHLNTIVNGQDAMLLSALKEHQKECKYFVFSENFYKSESINGASLGSREKAKIVLQGANDYYSMAKEDMIASEDELLIKAGIGSGTKPLIGGEAQDFIVDYVVSALDSTITE